MPNASDRLAPLLLDVPTTVAELPADSVETLPTVIVVLGGPCGPCGPIAPAVDTLTLIVSPLEAVSVGCAAAVSVVLTIDGCEIVADVTPLLVTVTVMLKGPPP
jgi:hypothetical protein